MPQQARPKVRGQREDWRAQAMMASRLVLERRGVSPGGTEKGRKGGEREMEKGEDVQGIFHHAGGCDVLGKGGFSSLRERARGV